MHSCCSKKQASRIENSKDTNHTWTKRTATLELVDGDSETDAEVGRNVTEGMSDEE
jgi:hypothetical protein